MNTGVVYLLCTIVFLIGSIGVASLLKRNFHKLKHLDSQCYKFTEEEFNSFQAANIRVQRTLATPKIIPIPTEEVINNGAYLLKKRGFLYTATGRTLLNTTYKDQIKAYF